MLESYHIWVIHQAHQLKLTVLVPSILQNLFNGDSLPSLQTSCLNVVIMEDIKVRTDRKIAVKCLIIGAVTWKTTPNDPVPTTRSAM